MILDNLTPNDMALFILLVVCLFTDIRERRIYNKVVFPAMVIGILYGTVMFGWDGCLQSLKGLGLGIGLLLVPFIFGGFGAGDVKLLGAIGALKGPGFVFNTFLFTGLSGGIIAVGFLIYQRKLWATLRRVGMSLYILLGSKLKVNTLKNLDQTEYHEAFPYGIAIVAGTVATYLVR